MGIVQDVDYMETNDAYIFLLVEEDIVSPKLK